MRSEADGKFVALTAVSSTHGCVQLCEDAEAVRVSPMDAAVSVHEPVFSPVAALPYIQMSHVDWDRADLLISQEGKLRSHV